MSQKQITNISSGIYFNEIDLTVVQQNAGTFAGAAIGLMEKGPAFEPMGFSTFEERVIRMGSLNPAFKSSYYAREFLSQASNYKEVRILGLEGYNEDVIIDSNGNNVGGLGKSFIVMYKNGSPSPAGNVLNITTISIGADVTISVSGVGLGLVAKQTVSIKDVQGLTIDGLSISGEFFIDNVVETASPDITSFTIKKFDGSSYSGVGSYVAGTGTVSALSPVLAIAESIACVLKPRRTSDTSAPVIDYITVDKVLNSDNVLAATDELFSITVYYRGNRDVNVPLGPIKCSLREGTPSYIATVFGRDPLDTTKVLGLNSPLWVEYVYPSIQAIPDIAAAKGYYYPGFGLNNSLDYDPQAANSTLPVPLSTLDLVTGNVTVSKNFEYSGVGITAVTVGTDVLITTEIAHGLVDMAPVTLAKVNMGGTNPYPIDGNWYAKASDAMSFYVVDANGNAPINVTGSFTREAGSLIRKTFTPTWESEIMDLGGTGKEIEYQTPLTPWFVSDFDNNGSVKRLFRFWSISDGESANLEIKVEVSNINPDGNNGSGSFDIYVRNFEDAEDTGRQVYEGYSNLTLDPKSSNYILRRIGDGDQFPMNSKFIFVELNEDDTIPRGTLPYGCEGYANTAGLTTPDLHYTTQYDLSKSVAKQILGLSNNSINTFKKVKLDNLTFKNITSLESVGKGFHLNPRYITAKASGTTEGKGGVQDEVLYNTITKSFFLVDHRAYNTSSSNSAKTAGIQKVARAKFVVSMAGGFDAWNVYKQREWDLTTSNDRKALDKAIDVLADYESLFCDFSVLVTPDFDFQNSPSATAAVLEMVESRGDALYLFDFDYGYVSGIKPTINAIDAKIALESSSMKSSFSACHYPDVQLKDDFNNINPWLPASIVALATIASVATNENVWQPPAGSLRTVTQNLVRTRKRMKINDREILKSANINPITEFPGSGFEITETRTTQDVFSALSFIHNRLLLGYAKKALNQVLRPLLHQLKNDNLRDAFLNAVRPIFARIKRLNGLEDFDVIATGLSEDRTTLHGRIVITPLYPTERIIVDFVLKDGGINYNG